MVNYTLVNPFIRGEMQTEFSASSNINAANKCWSTMSKHFTNYIPKFAFTLQNDEGGLHHFEVSESMDPTSKRVDYTINEMNNSVSEENEEKIKKSARKLQKGGSSHSSKRRHRYNKYGLNDDEDDDSDSDDYLCETLKYEHMRRRSQQPILLWNYYPAIYDVEYYFFPTFEAPLTPYILFRW